MLKKIFFFCLLASQASIIKAQLIELQPNNLQLPQVGVLPGCAAADYGKMVFLTTTNKAHVCNGTGWVVIETASGGGGGGSLTLPYSANGSFSTQGFQIINTGGGSNSAALQGTTLSVTNDAAGVWGSANSASPTGETIAVRGSNLSTNNNGIGIKGTHAGGGYGVMGFSAIGTGIYGITSGTSSTGFGVLGESNQASGVGVHGKVSGSGATGVYGLATNIGSNGGFFQNNAGGVALNTFGKLRFQGNGAAANSVLVSQDATGNALWESLTRTEILKLGPSDFQSHISTNASTLGNQGISMTSAAGAFHASISVPNGATITSLKIHYIDNDSSLGFGNWSLQKMANTGAPSYSVVFGITIPNGTANSNIQNLSHTLQTPEVVNNATTLYRIVVTTSASVNLVLVGADVNYTYTVNN